MLLSILLSCISFSGCNTQYQNENFENTIWIDEDNELEGYMFIVTNDGKLIADGFELYKTSTNKLARMPSPDGTCYLKIDGTKIFSYDETGKVEENAYLRIKNKKLHLVFQGITLCVMQKSEYKSIEEYAKSLGYEYLGEGQY